MAQAQAQAQYFDIEKLQLSIRRVVERWCREPAFHHVLTELAMLKIRRSASKVQNHGIIPVALDRVDIKYLSFLDGCDLRLKLNPSLCCLIYTFCSSISFGSCTQKIMVSLTASKTAMRKWPIVYRRSSILVRILTMLYLQRL